MMRKKTSLSPITSVERLAASLRAIRRERKITQQALAERAEIGRAHV